MPRGKGRGGRRKAPSAAGFTSDVEMKDADLSLDERPKRNTKNSSLKPKNQSDRRGRVGKNSPSPQTAGTRGSKPKGGGDGPNRVRLKANMTMLASRARNSNRRLSIISAASTTLSAQDAGPWCDKCTSLNRQLHGYLLEILKQGEDAIGDWAYAVGASPDHMECEPAPERIIPEGYRRCSRQHHLCAAMTEGEPGTIMPPPLSAGWPGTAFTSAVYDGKPANALSQTSAGCSPYSQLGSGLDLAQRMQQTNLVPAGGDIQNRQTLVAIPEHPGPYAHRTGPPSQAPLPVPQPLQPTWNGGFQRPVAMYPNSGPTQNTSHNPPGSMAYNEAMRGIGQGRELQGEQKLPDSEIPE